MQLVFGQGALFAERSDLGFTSGVGPQQFGVLQDITVDFDWTTKELYGQNIFPVAIARAQAKITGKARFAQVLGQIYTDIIFGGPVGAGGPLTVVDKEAATIPGTAPFQITVAQAASFVDDLGVRYRGSTTIQDIVNPIPSGFETLPGAFKRVTTPSAAAQYSVNENTGVYTFSSADANDAISISYTFLQVSGRPQLFIPNTQQGVTPVFKATLKGTFAGKDISLRLNACTSSKFSFPARINEWLIQEMDFMAFSDSTGQVGVWSWAE